MGFQPGLDWSPDAMVTQAKEKGGKGSTALESLILLDLGRFLGNSLDTTQIIVGNKKRITGDREKIERYINII